MAGLLEVRSLWVRLGAAVLVRDVSLEVDAGHVHALIGESGCGKSSLARALLGLQPDGARVSGEVWVDGAPARCGPLTLVPQEAQASLNPVLTIGDQVGEVLQVHQGLTGSQRRSRTAALLEAVGLVEARALLGAFPHQLSGGMRQRVLIAAALAASPRVLIADEPTASLDAALRAQVLQLFGSLAATRGLAALLITHELAAVEVAAHEVSVMYAGAIVEQGPAAKVMGSPRHPYTRALLAARPSAGLHAIDGVAPAPTETIIGCRFQPRCPRVVAACSQVPSLVEGLACFNPERA
jgi:oligopeptide/dipeptide ABC transporter ATP-binding protein